MLDTPCKHGHLAPRRVTTKRCIVCERECVDRYQASPEGKLRIAQYRKSEAGKASITARQERYRAKPNSKLVEKETSRRSWLAKSPEAKEAHTAWKRSYYKSEAGKRALERYRSRPEIKERIRQGAAANQRKARARALQRKWRAERMD